MRKSLVLFMMSGLALLFLAAPQSRADGVDTFSFTEPAYGLVYNATWQLPGTPDTTGEFTTGTDFDLPDTVDLSLDGVFLYSQLLDFNFCSATSGSGELLDSGSFGLSGIGQLYSGSESSPDFLPGTYTGTDPYTGFAATLVISAPAISTPEPSALLLLSVALVAIAGVLFVRKLQL